jgi:hypothetical protein
MKGCTFIGVRRWMLLAEAPDTALALHAALRPCRGLPPLGGRL